MAVVLARVDNRLVHGQVLEAWVPCLGVGSILVVDRELGQDPLQKMVIEGLSRRGLQVQIVAPAEVNALLDGDLRGVRVMMLFAGLSQALDARDAGVPFGELNLGNIHPRQDSRSLTMSVYLTNEDDQLLRQLVERGVALEARALPADHSPDVRRWLEEIPKC